MYQKKYSFHNGDKVFARIIVNGSSVIEFIADRIQDMSQLLSLVRNRTRCKCSGLAKLYVRNMSRGWSVERPIYIYPDTYTDSDGERRQTYHGRLTPGIIRTPSCCPSVV